MILYRWRDAVTDSTLKALEGGEAPYPAHDEEDNKTQPQSGAKRRKDISKSRLKHAALDFLSNISLESEVAAGDNETVPDADSTAPLPDFLRTEKSLPDPSSVDKSIGIRVRGETQYQYVCLKSKNLEDGDVGNRASFANGNEQLRREAKEEWEDQLVNSGIHSNARLFLSWSKAYPCMVTSIVKYDGVEDSSKRKTLRLSSVVLELPKRKQEAPVILPGAKWVQHRYGTSYARYINEDWAILSKDTKWSPEEDVWDSNYNPDVLHDPRIRQGRNGIVKALPGYTFSVLKYTRNKDLKNELNQVFREQHPQLPLGLTLSKIRNLKREALEHAKVVDIDLTTVALAIVYFEKLVFKGIVTKPNRKLVMSVCLVLAFKFNEETKGAEQKLSKLLQDIREVQSLRPKQVLKAEFSVLAHLNFRLNIPDGEWFPHVNHLLKSIEKTPTEYFGRNTKVYFEVATELEATSSSDSSSSSSTSDSPST